MSDPRIDMRAEFEVDACFGGMPLGPDLCKRHSVTGDYIDQQTEAVFQVWCRGHKSCAVDVRNALQSMLEKGAPNGTCYVRDALEYMGLCAKQR